MVAERSSSGAPVGPFRKVGRTSLDFGDRWHHRCRNIGCRPLRCSSRSSVRCSVILWRCPRGPPTSVNSSSRPTDIISFWMPEARAPRPGYGCARSIRSTAQPLAGTEEATYPFWSPDSRWIAFFSRDKLKKISVNGGPVQTLCDAPTGRGGAWSRSGVIVFAADNGNNGLSRVSETGGAPAPLTKVETGTHRWPWFLPDGRHFLYMAARGKSNGIHLASLDSDEDKRLVADESNPAYRAPSARRPVRISAVCSGEDSDGSAGGSEKPRSRKASFFRWRSRYPEATTMAAGCTRFRRMAFWSTKTGRAGEVRQHTWFDRTGKEVGHAGGTMRSLNSFSVSPDGKRMAIERPADSGSGTDLWLADLEHGTESRFTFDASLNSGPVWSPDGARIAFESNRGDGNARLYQRLSNNTGPDELLFESKFGAAAQDWSRDGKYIIFRPGPRPHRSLGTPADGRAETHSAGCHARGCGNRDHGAALAGRAMVGLHHECIRSVPGDGAAVRPSL